MTAPASALTRVRARIIGLDGARGLSCLGVAVTHVTGHYSPVTAHEWKTSLVGLALIFFYALSGFLLFLPYVRNLIENRELPSTANFAVHRVARILPGYLVIFLLCNYLLQIAYVQNASMQPTRTENGTGMITDPWQLIANLTLTQSYIPKYFQTGLNPSWSLTLEYAFYLSIPLLGMLLFAIARRSGMRPWVIVSMGPALLIALGFIGRAFVPWFTSMAHLTDVTEINWGANWVAVYTKCFLTNSDTFAFGMAAAVVVVAMEHKVIREKLSRRIRLYSFVAMFPMGLLMLVLIALANPYATSALAIVCALAILVIVAPLFRGERSGLAEFLDTAPFRFVGKISLSAYLWHFPLMLLLGRWGLMASDNVPGMLRNVALVLVVTIAVSTVTYYAVEEPVMKFAKRYRTRWS
ncbi:acyltransferase [Mycobacterium sp. CBMA293]|uniref:acyltransferase family protein n=1 Tax=unclassified Mycolicibacterium TaxID=2636767 RepID=UPI001321A2CA|nr:MULTISPECIES: acyltransferase [unclassified Mycolicibacterium]MUL46805.1 acyltransferase [Mycolicibacterium sp. CBMA 360]MUL92498.1 acyltransferase [Mycolicibacterium sp. CBMA 230]MUL57410.1 acyltransferase [Mycolicibacterium sp. CBMA 335]MUL70450.1 acyltransferase [Mycolicibacterium sp. CBMA 311]MUM04873.1 acyltransferase [Mycolicibacterium sp. CBMA 213]